MRDVGRDLVVDTLVRPLRLVVLAISTVLLVGFALLLPLAEPAPEDWITRQAIAFALLAVVDVVAAVAVLRDRTIGRVRWVLAAAVFTAAALTTAGVPGPQLMTKASWSYVTLGWFLLLVLIEHSTRAAAVLLGAFTAATFVQLVVVGQGARVADLVVVSTLALGYEMSVLAVATASRRIATTAVDAAAREEQARTADAIAEHLHADRRRRYAELADSTVPLLRALTDGTADLRDPRARAEYAVAAARLRRLFAEHDEVVDPLLHELRACLDLAERKGVDVYLGACGSHPEPPLAVRRALTEPVVRVMAGARTSARVTVLGSPTGVTVSVVTDVADGVAAEPEPAARTDVGVLVTSLVDGQEVWVEATWQAPS
ncbi:hypothetical protein [Labedaea rhizosphaerae]|uniref:Signal transduction histidine kinase n=1 Tax=Labedaea rhizosphaerae TaxID=598644 RepID=A0A4R6SC56_LABRH|nr:hypothetical protein [Labedaea rhizosphaerae]TDP97542.1 hypothetical protein EV186_103506 [Labedaea rhizosphaerae]